MPFQKGFKRAPGAGRKAGTPNKRSQEFLDILAKNNFCPASAMIEIYTEAKKIYQGYAVVYEAIRSAKSGQAGFDVPLEDKCDKYLRIAGDMAKEIATYTYAKRKAIETTVDQSLIDAIKGLENKSTEELLAILNQNNLP